MMAATTRPLLSDIGERPDAGDVADRPHAIRDPHRRIERRGHAGRPRWRRFEPAGVDTRAPAGGDAHEAAAQLAAVAELRDVVPAVAARRGDAHPERRDQYRRGAGPDRR